MKLSSRSKRASISMFVLLFALGLVVGGLAIFYVNYRQISTLNSRVTDLSSQVSSLQSQVATFQGGQNQTITNQTVTVVQNGTDLASLYANVSSSVVMIQGTTSTGSVQGSGFVYNYQGQMVVITNFHVVFDASSLSVTFSNGHAYTATTLGSDPYADMAVLRVSSAPANEFKPLQIVSSSSLRVGDQVIAIGNPYGLVGSLTTGVVSALGRSLQESEQTYMGNFSIANVIQTSTPINPGNSGGPLLNAAGGVVGITTAIVSDSQGLGFAIPSNTILREIASLFSTGSYNLHSYLGVMGGDMTFDQAQTMKVNYTYGWLVGSTVSGGPSDGKLQENDIIIALNGTTIRNNDDLASYLEGNTIPNDVVKVTVVRNNALTTVDVTLGTRPTPQL